MSFLGGVAWPGAVLGSVLAALLFAADTARSLRSGLGTVVDVVGGVMLAALAMVLVGSAVVLLRLVFRRCPWLFLAGLLGPFAVLFALLLGPLDAGPGVSLRFGGALLLLSAALGGAIALVTRRPPGMSGARRAIGWSCFTLVLSGWIVLAAWLWSPGTDPYAARQASPSVAPIARLTAEDPSRKGPHVVRWLSYGSGRDRRRPEYGIQVSLRTEAVDASRLLKALKGVRAKARTWYWGFGADAFPINGRVWYPDGNGPFPLVLIVHGNHRMEDDSDTGYAYLGQVMASRGFIFVSVDENFLNRSWSGEIGGENGARGFMLLKHLETWRRWNETPGHPFHRRVDMDRIALIGHSRGGEAVAHAAAFNRLPCLPDDCTVRFDFHFAIRALVALAPIDGGYLPASQPVPIENVSYLVLHGSHDGDVPSFEGLRPFRRVKLDDGPYRFKAAVYIHRANHNHFNTVWGRDLESPFTGFALQKVLLGEEEQRRIAAVFIGGFLEATLNGRREYVPMFRDVRAAGGWLPETTYVSQFEDSTYKAVSDFTAGIDLSRGTLPGSILSGENLTIWRRGDFRGRGDQSLRVGVVYLGWGDKDKNGAPPVSAGIASYRITLPPTTAARWDLDARSRLVFVVADTHDFGNHDAAMKRAPIDFTIEVTTLDGAVSRVPLSRLLPLHPLLRVAYTKWRYLDRAFFFGDTEPVFQTYEIPLEMFAAPGWHPARIRDVRFVFDRTPSGTIALAEVGFAPTR